MSLQEELREFIYSWGALGAGYEDLFERLEEEITDARNRAYEEARKGISEQIMGQLYDPEWPGGREYEAVWTAAHIAQSWSPE